MKYLEYTLVLLWTIIRKPLGLVMIYPALPFRAYANNVVFNYVLQNGMYLKRLLERPIIHIHGKLNPLETLGWEIAPYHGTEGGYIKYRKISWLEYTIVYWLIWGWLDSDSNEDTYAWGHVEKLRQEWRWFAYVTKGLQKPFYGNSFDLGDKRAEYPSFNFWTTTQWTWRNTAYNFRYMQWEKRASDKNLWLVSLSNGWEFGWKPDKSNSTNYSLVFLGWK